MLRSKAALLFYFWKNTNKTKTKPDSYLWGYLYTDLEQKPKAFKKLQQQQQLKYTKDAKEPKLIMFYNKCAIIVFYILPQPSNLTEEWTNEQE